MPALSNSLDLLREIKAQLSNPRNIVLSDFHSQKPKRTSERISQLKPESMPTPVPQLKSEPQFKRGSSSRGKIQINRARHDLECCSQTPVFDYTDNEEEELAEQTVRIINQLRQAMSMQQRENETRIDELISKRQQQLREMKQRKGESRFAKVFQLLDEMESRAIK